MNQNKTIGLALSGGGYRAAAFHLGTLKALNKMGVLDKIDRLSTISGGSITGTCFCIKDGTFGAFEKDMIRKLTTKSVIGYILTSRHFIFFCAFSIIFIGGAVWLEFTRLAPLSIVIISLYLYLLFRFQFYLLPVSKVIEKAYDEFFYENKKLKDLCDFPEIAIGSTNLKSARHFTFSKRKMEDSAYTYRPVPILFNNAAFPISRAVVASSCVPFAFTPVTIAKEFYQKPDLAEANSMELVDGGVYDNQGVHKLTERTSSYRTDIIIVSDAGNKLPFYKMNVNTLTLLIRTVDVFMQRIKNFQMASNVYQNSLGKEIAYLSLGWDLPNCVTGFIDNLKKGNIEKHLIEAHGLKDEWLADINNHEAEILNQLKSRCHYEDVSKTALPTEQLAQIRKISTNLTPIKKALMDDLITHAAALTEIQVRLYCPSSLI